MNRSHAEIDRGANSLRVECSSLRTDATSQPSSSANTHFAGMGPASAFSASIAADELPVLFVDVGTSNRILIPTGDDRMPRSWGLRGLDNRLDSVGSGAFGFFDGYMQASAGLVTGHPLGTSNGVLHPQSQRDTDSGITGLD